MCRADHCFSKSSRPAFHFERQHLLDKKTLCWSYLTWCWHWHMKEPHASTPAQGADIDSSKSCILTLPFNWGAAIDLWNSCMTMLPYFEKLTLTHERVTCLYPHVLRSHHWLIKGAAWQHSRIIEELPLMYERVHLEIHWPMRKLPINIPYFWGAAIDLWKSCTTTLPAVKSSLCSCSHLQ